jgi:SAM-dependent methyltransferase
MGSMLGFLADYNARTKRDYVKRVTDHDKAECATVAKRFGQEYWDGDRRYGYGGYRYDGRWAGLATKLIQRYRLGASSRVLDVGCGKGFLLHEIRQQVPGISVTGVDISQYAIENAKEEVRPFLQVGHARKLDFPDRSFDLVLSLGTLHNLYLFDLWSALQEIQRVSRGQAYVMSESYRNEREKANLLYWQLTCESFFTPDEWAWLFAKTGYTGDYEFIYFE